MSNHEHHRAFDRHVVDDWNILAIGQLQVLLLDLENAFEVFHVTRSIAMYLPFAPGDEVVAVELTARQREVLQLVAEGYSMKEAARILNVSPRTIAFHKYRIMDLLRLKTNSELVQFAIKKGIISVTSGSKRAP